MVFLIGSRRLVAMAFLALSFSPCQASSQTVSATTDPVGFQNLVIRGGTDNVLSLPMEQPAVFAGTVQAFTQNSLTISAGGSGAAPISPQWTAGQFVYSAPQQTRTFLVEFSGGSLKGVYFRITANTADTLTLDTLGDSLTAYGSLGTVAAGDSIRIRPYWRVRDAFENNGAPIIEARPDAFSPRDEILIPSTLSGTNKAPGTTIFYVSGQGWRAAGKGSEDYGDYVLPPNEGLILRRRNAANLTLTNLGEAAIIRSVSFVPGGDGTTANDTYISLQHPVPVTLDQSGLRSGDQANSVIRDSTSDFARQDELLEFSPTASGFNVAPSATYYYRAGQGWKKVGGGGAIVGSTVVLQPGTAYIVRKKGSERSVDWVKDPNF